VVRGDDPDVTGAQQSSQGGHDGRLIVDEQGGKSAHPATSVRVGEAPEAAARRTVTVVPPPGTLWMSMVPACRVMIPWQTARPRPVPSPTERVVKNGSNTRASDSLGMPCPLSAIRTAT